MIIGGIRGVGCRVRLDCIVAAEPDGGAAFSGRVSPHSRARSARSSPGHGAGRECQLEGCGREPPGHRPELTPGWRSQSSGLCPRAPTLTVIEDPHSITPNAASELRRSPIDFCVNDAQPRCDRKTHRCCSNCPEGRNGSNYLWKREPTVTHDAECAQDWLSCRRNKMQTVPVTVYDAEPVTRRNIQRTASE
jgi:hypothetical protein